MEISQLLELNQIAKGEGKRYPKKRTPYYDQIMNSLGKHFTGIVGPRGAGKTVLLKQLACQLENSFYLSVDTLNEGNLFDLAKTLKDLYHIQFLFIDEIHFQKSFESDLKKIFDFLSLQVVFTSSVALAMIESAYDLSRRVKLVYLYPFSFREFLFFKQNIILPSLTIDDIVEKRWTSEHLQFEYAFEAYLRGGLYPFSLEEADPLPLLKNVLQKIIQKDIPAITDIKTDEILLIEKMLKFIGQSEVDGINCTSIAKNLGVTKYKAEKYLQLLQKSFVLNPVFPAGTNVLKEPKVLMCLPYRLLYKSYVESIGAIREDFFAESMTMAQLEFHYLKSTRGKKTPDFLVLRENDGLIVEVGGKGKGKEQFKGIKSKAKIRLIHANQAEGNKRPLFLLGYLL